MKLDVNLMEIVEKTRVLLSVRSPNAESRGALLTAHSYRLTASSQA